MTKYSNCNSDQFHTDLSELCETCPIHQKLPLYIDEQILKQALEQKEILSQTSYKAYLSSEIANAQEAMAKINRLQGQDQTVDDIGSRIEVYILNKERIKVLSKLEMELNIPEPQLKEKVERMKNELSQCGFFTLDKVSKISANGQEELVGLLGENVHYDVAMLEFLGFIDLLFSDYVKQFEAYKKLYQIIKPGVRDTTHVRKIHNSLDRVNDPYTSAIHKENAINDYKRLK